MQRGVGAADQLVAVAAAQLVGLGRGHAARDVAADRVGRRLVGDDVGRDAALEQRVHHVGDVGDEADRDRLAPVLCAEHQRERLVEIVRAVLQVALAQAPVDALGIDLDDERRRAREHAGQRLGAAHAAEARSQHEAPGERAAEVLAPGRHERLVGALQDALRADVLPGAGRHAAVHREAGVDQLLRVRPGSPSDRRGCRWRSRRSARAGACRRGRPACPTGRRASGPPPSS